MYSIVQFLERDGGTVSIVHKKWLTPRRGEVYWPPVKERKALDRLLTNGNSILPDTTSWKLYGVQRLFYETDNLEKAKEKLKRVEVTSDLATEDEDSEVTRPKRLCQSRKTFDTSDEEEVPDNHVRPPPLKNKLSSYLKQDHVFVADHVPHLTPTKQYNLEKAKEKWVEVTSDLATEDEDSEVTRPKRLCQSRKTFDASDEEEVPDNHVRPPPLKNKLSSCYQDKVVSLLAHIKAQNDIIISILNTKPKELNTEFKFPLETFEDLERAEQLLEDKENRDSLAAYFKSLGGRGPNSKVSRVMKMVLSDSMASKFNFFGKRSDKKAFAELRLRKSIVESLKNTDTNTTEKEIEDAIKMWLKHAPEREKKRLSKNIN